MRTIHAIVCLLGFAVAALAPSALGDASDHVYRYVGGAYAERAALATGGICTGAREWDGDSWVDAPVVVGGACAIPVAGAVHVSVIDDGWENAPVMDGQMPFRWELRGGSASGPAGEGVTCAVGGTAWGVAVLDVPEGCTDLSVYLSELATTGILRTFAP